MMRIEEARLRRDHGVFYRYVILYVSFLLLVLYVVFSY